MEKVSQVLEKNKSLLPKTSVALKKLIVAIRSNLAQKGDIKQWAASLVDKDDLGVAIKQLELFYNTFRQIQNSWENISKLFQQEDFDTTDFQQMRNLLNQAISGGFMNKVMQFFKTKPFPGLEPKQIIDDIIKSVEDVYAGAEGPEAAQAALETLNSIMNSKLPNLSAFSKQEAQPTQTPDAPAQTQQAAGTQSTQPTGKTTEQQAQSNEASQKVKGVQNDPQMSDDEKQIATQLANPDNMAKVLSILKKAGYNVSPI